MMMFRKGEINEMREEMEDVCDDICVFEDSAEIDLDFEFNVAKYFDFTRVELVEEVEESESWFVCAAGHAPSPLVAKFGWRMDEVSESETCSSMNGCQSTYSTSSYSHLCGASENSSLSKGKTGQKTFGSKPRSSSQEHSRISRLLKPTASQLAKQNDQVGNCSARIPGRPQKLRSSLKSPGENVASKRQKLEMNYLRKVGHLMHQLSYSHKVPKQVVSSPTRPKVTIPKEPALATAQRAQRHRSTTNAAQPGKISKSNSSLSLQEKSDPEYKFKARSFNKKILSSKGDAGILRTTKREATHPRELKLSKSKTLPQNPPTELFSKLSLNSENQPEEKQHIREKGLKKSTTCSTMKENKEIGILR